MPIDVALISVSPPDSNGMCSLGVSVDIVKSAATNARYLIAQVNSNMPRTMGDSFLHVNNIDMLVSFDEPMIQIPVHEPDETLHRIGQNVARLIEDGSTIECGIGRIPQAIAEFLKDKKDLEVHTEMFSDWIINLVECGAITCSKKTINRGKVIASFCMGSQRLYDFVDNNPFFDFRPTEYVNDPYVISQHENMVAINVGLEIDLTGQVCSDSLGYKFYSGIGGQVDFVRGAARSRNGKAIIVLPSTARADSISRIVPHLAEGAGVAFIVQDEWQKKGMGTFLLAYITETAKQRGVRRFYAKVLPSNKAMLAIFQNSGYSVNTEFDGEVYSVVYEL